MYYYTGRQSFSYVRSSVGDVMTEHFQVAIRSDDLDSFVFQTADGTFLWDRTLSIMEVMGSPFRNGAPRYEIQHAAEVTWTLWHTRIARQYLRALQLGRLFRGVVWSTVQLRRCLQRASERRG